MRKLIKFLCLSINSFVFLYAASITNLSADKNKYNKGNTAHITYSIDDKYRYKLRFQAYDSANNLMSPDNFSATEFGKISFVIPRNYNQNKITINLTLMDKKGNIKSKKLILNVNQTMLLNKERRILSGDDGYTSISLPFTFHGYNVIYPNENGYITFTGGAYQWSGYVRAYNPMIWTSSSDLMTNVYITEWSNKVKIRWQGGYYPGWHGSFSSWVILYSDGRIYQSSGGYYGF